MVLALLAKIFQGNREIDAANNLALQTMASAARGIASEEFEAARKCAVACLGTVTSDVNRPGFWPVLQDPDGVRILTELRAGLHECHRHELLELRIFGSAGDAFRSGATQSPVSEKDIRAAQKEFAKALDRLGATGGKLARHYKIPHQELQAVI